MYTLSIDTNVFGFLFFVFFFLQERITGSDFVTNNDSVYRTLVKATSIECHITKGRYRSISPCH